MFIGHDLSPNTIIQAEFQNEPQKEKRRNFPNICKSAGIRAVSRSDIAGASGGEDQYEHVISCPSCRQNKRFGFKKRSESQVMR